MAESPHPTSGISLGPGGRITDAALVEELERVPVLQPKELVKLAIYFSAFETNAYLGNLLWKKTLENIVTHPRIAPVVRDVFAINILLAEETLEDLPHGEDSDETSIYEDPIFVFAFVSRIGLLIQKVLLEKEETAFFVIGISPDPKDLPDPEDSEASAGTSPK